MHPYSHLSLFEREHIMISKSQNKSISEIANDLGRNKSTISRELRRNSGTSGYSASVAQECYSNRRINSCPMCKISDSRIYA